MILASPFPLSSLGQSILMTQKVQCSMLLHHCNRTSAMLPAGQKFSSQSSISKFLAPEPTFGSTGLRDSYSPWSDLDKFGWAEIIDVINSVTPKGPKVSAAEDAPSTSKASSSFMVPKPGKRRSHLISDEELNKSAERLNASLDKS